jgi:CHAT domain-containing protein
MGMTRAWLAAGAHSVVASLWPTPDDQGKLFVSFYGHLAQLRRDASGGGAAEALRRAQLDMLASHSWHSSPGYWAAYTVAGKE